MSLHFFRHQCTIGLELDNCCGSVVVSIIPDSDAITAEYEISLGALSIFIFLCDFDDVAFIVFHCWILHHTL